MTGPKSTESVRDEAHAWVSKLVDAFTAADREAFERWLSEDPAHQEAFDEVSKSYDQSVILRMSKVGRERDLDAVSRKGWNLGYGLAAAAAAGLAIVGGFELTHQLELRPVALESAMLLSGADARDVMLADGSKVSLAPASEVRIDLGRSERRAQLNRGRVRVSIVQERRPFHIAAGLISADVSAGVFDAAIVNGQGVIAPATARQGAGSTDPGHQRSERVPPNVPANQQVLEFSGTPLGQAVDRINQAHNGRRIELDPSLAGLRVTGVFQHGDTEAIARSLALAFGLKLTSTTSGAVLLTR